MSPVREFEAQKAGATADVERIERDARQDQIEDTVPSAALGRGPDTMAEILVEMGSASVPMSGDLSFDRIGLGITDMTYQGPAAAAFASHALERAGHHEAACA
jgi:hypothetical protein